MTIVKGKVLTMAEYLEKSKITEYIKTFSKGLISDKRDFDIVDDTLLLCEAIDFAPDADVVEVKHGYWEEVDSTPKGQMFHCSVCHKTAYFPQPTRDKTWKKQCPYTYCPNCGAKMDERVVQDDDT